MGVYFISLITGANAIQTHCKDKKRVTVETGVKHVAIFTHNSNPP